MKRIWAPWRLEYILEAGKKSKLGTRRAECVFCAVQQGRPSQKNLVLLNSSHAYVVMNKYPYTNGHLMVIPKRHTNDFAQLTADEHEDMGGLLSKSVQVLKNVFHPQGFNIGMNLGEAAGAGIREHLHYHIVPRWLGDNNFMPVVGEVRVMLEHVKKTYLRLKREFDKSS